jgi:site-specific DNA recombinase
MEAIYARQSIDKADSVSIEAQIAYCKRFTSEEACEIYLDRGWSGKNMNRPGLNRLTEHVRKNKITKVMVYRLDRISRNIVDFGKLLTLFEDHSVNFFSATENFDTAMPMGRAMVYIVMVFAQLERETIAQRIRDNYKFRCSTGRYYMGGGIPYGYMTQKTVIDGKKASILVPGVNADHLKMIFELFTSGFGLYQTVSRCNALGIRTSREKLWTVSGMKRILKNITPCTADDKLYAYLEALGYSISSPPGGFDGKHGMCMFLKWKNKNQRAEMEDTIVVVGSHQPIISSEQYIKAQILLDRNKEERHSKKSRNTFLTGLMKCQECGFGFGLKKTSGGKKTYAYYYCRGRHSHGMCDNKTFIKAQVLEQAIMNACSEYLGTLFSMIQVQTKSRQINTADEILLLEQQIENLVCNIGLGNRVVDEALTQKITVLQAHIKELEKKQRMDFISTSIQEHTGKIKSRILKWGDCDMEEKSEVMKKMIDYITISKNGEINIHFLV